MGKKLYPAICIAIAQLIVAVPSCAVAKETDDASSRSASLEMMQYIARSGSACVAKTIVDYIHQGANVNAYVNENYPLILALLKGADTCAITLIAHGARSGIKESVGPLETTALVVTAGVDHCNPKMVRMLLKLGAAPNQRSRGVPPLASAALAKNIQCAKALIAAGANVNYAAWPRNITPLMMAQLNGPIGDPRGLKDRIEMTKLLLAHGAKPDIQTKFVAGDAQDAGLTALFYAIGLAKPIVPCAQCAKLLLRAGAKPNIVNGAGETPLLWALALEHETNEAAIGTLIKGGADVNLANPKTGETPLMAAAKRGDERLVKLLLRSNADEHERDKKGRTAADYARLYRHPQLAEWLDAKG